ncbi:aldose epimerase family protein [Salinisphaera sp.]|uniref:aldose epimerase family protein n=1 Tax=Salinisphaera sp. TaxID=1914330 RepID=UPI002D78E3A6|nr:aldose epimerase family protein [Salinisphaera sp.]HET7313547.1 aldose epimerase family protein [Salinisphaera sp.]
MSEPLPDRLAVIREPFGTTPEGGRVDRYVLTNRRGMRVAIVTHGARIQAIEVPDKNGHTADVVLGFDRLDDYLDAGNSYFGATIGPFANRIAGAAFELGGRSYRLSANENGNTLHGGERGFDRQVWAAVPIDENDTVGVELTHLSPDGDMGFPGNLAVTLRYTLDNANNLRLHYSAVADADTVINLTNHAFFNLAGAGNGTIREQLAMIHGEHVTAVDGALIPTGELTPVAGGAMDFTRPKPFGRDIADDALSAIGGYDHNWVLAGAGDLNRLAVRAVDPASGRALEMYSTEPGVQVYTGNDFDGSLIGKNGAAYDCHGAFTLEAQHFPDTPHQPAFPGTTLASGEKYTQTTVYRFTPG